MVICCGSPSGLRQDLGDCPVQHGSHFPDGNWRFRKPRGLSLLAGPSDASQEDLYSLFPLLRLKSSQPVRMRFSLASAQHSPPRGSGRNSLNRQLRPRLSYLALCSSICSPHEYDKIRTSESWGSQNKEKQAQGWTQTMHSPSWEPTLFLRVLTSDFLPEKQNKCTKLTGVCDEE